ncbi:MAG TPA: CPBP family intramembrane glutamic endopeptidase [Chthoniobacterales bacterium]|nr:CPBP family intramembrane glutamic endopeptidase [Chthoniobacterales bacterium]
MFGNAFTSAAGNIVFALYFLASVGVFVSLIRQIRARKSATEFSISESTRTFDWPEALLAAGLVSFLLLNVFTAIFRSERVQLNSHDLIPNLLLVVVVVLFITTFLRVRGLDLDSLGGFSRISFVRAASTGVILIFFTYPLLGIAESIVQALFGLGSGRQEIVDLFTSSGTLRQRVIIVILAVVVAPISEEFIFRFFLYGVLKRYFGIGLALLFNAFLFAAVHTHLPSLAPLFVLGACFTLAYEWSGSILVSMTMHALFNGVQLTVLAFPQLIQQ